MQTDKTIFAYIFSFIPSHKMKMSAMLINSELIKFKRENQLSILRVTAHKLFHQATPLMCKLHHDSSAPPSKQESFSKSSFPAGLGEALNCIQSEISPTKALFHLTSHWSWHHCFPTPTQHWGALESKSGEKLALPYCVIPCTHYTMN